jgi:hypothetical protein
MEKGKTHVEMGEGKTGSKGNRLRTKKRKPHYPASGSPGARRLAV